MTNREDTPMTDLSDHPFAIHMATEAAGLDGDRSDRAWERWCDEAEARLGHSLDGCGWIDGYSLDQALDAFEAGKTVEAFCDDVIAVRPADHRFATGKASY